MKRVLPGLLLIGIVGCEGVEKPPNGGAFSPPPNDSRAKAENVVADTPQAKVDADPVAKPKPKSAPGSKPKTDKPPAQAAVGDAVAALKNAWRQDQTE